MNWFALAKPLRYLAFRTVLLVESSHEIKNGLGRMQLLRDVSASSGNGGTLLGFASLLASASMP